MTKKDYELLAEAIKSSRQTGKIISSLIDPESQWLQTMSNIADALANDNPRFDREKFMGACGRWK